MIEDARLRRARVAVLVVFFVCGAALASWAVHVPLVQKRLSLSDGWLGLALLAMGLGAVVAMPATGRLVGRFGSRRLTAITTTLLCLSLPLPILAPSAALLMASLLLFGALLGGMDIAMNVQAVGVEREWGRPTMSLFHGLFSVGGLVGAGLGGIVLEAGISPRVHAFTVSGVLLVLSFAFLWKLIPETAEQRSAGPSFGLPTGPLLALSVLAFIVFGGEGAMLDWSAVYLTNILSAGPGLAAGGYAAFSLMMAVGRVSGDRLVTRFGPGGFARSSAALAAVGLAAVLLTSEPLVAIAGFGLVGLGLSNLVPILFSAAARTPGAPHGAAIAAVATAGYFGLLVGPPVIGFAAEVATLRGALCLVVLAIALVALRIRAAAEANPVLVESESSLGPAEENA